MEMSFNKIPSLMDFAIKHRRNILFIGEHGVGKTSMICQAFEDAGLNYRYYSASTMDPWVDFLGIPKEGTDENGNPVLRLVRPEGIDTEVEALVFDELNRSHPKIRNAVMELIQFKSINGRRFNNLKVVWAAINPADSESNYDVEELDPAQMDRFHHIISIPYLPDTAYFKTKFSRLGLAACEWWNSQKDDVKKKISPRRLDYTLDILKLGGEAETVLFNVDSNVVKSLNSVLQATLIEEQLSDIIKKIPKDLNTAKSEAISLCSSVRGRKTISGLINSNHELIPVLDLLSEEIKLSMTGEFNTDTLEKILKFYENKNQSKDASLVSSIEKTKEEKSNFSVERLKEISNSSEGEKRDILTDFDTIDGIVNSYFGDFKQIIPIDLRKKLIEDPNFGPIDPQAYHNSNEVLSMKDVFVHQINRVRANPALSQVRANPANKLVERSYQLAAYMAVRILAEQKYRQGAVETSLAYRVGKHDIHALVQHSDSLCQLLGKDMFYLPSFHDKILNACRLVRESENTNGGDGYANSM